VQYLYQSVKYALSFNDTLILISESNLFLIKIIKRILINDHNYKYSTTNH